MVLGILIACNTHRNTILLNDLQVNAMVEDSSLVVHHDYRIKARDLLFVTVNFLDSGTSFPSRSDSEDDDDERAPAFRPTDVYFRSYTVSDSGFLSLPLIGSIRVVGQTTEQVRKKLDESLAKHFKLATSQVKVANMRIVVLGEVLRPGNHYFFNNRMNIFEAISLAGDFNEFADRNRLTIVRETDEGRKSVKLNLSRIDVLHPYFIVKPGDIIYVEPLKTRSLNRIASSIGIVFSAVSTVAILARLILRSGSD